MRSSESQKGVNKFVKFVHKFPKCKTSNYRLSFQFFTIGSKLKMTIIFLNKAILS